MAKLVFTLLILCLTCLVNYGFAQDYTYQDSISSHQTCVTFTSINDGHPGPPKMPFFQSSLGYSFDGSPELNICALNTFATDGFFRKSLFSLNFLNVVYQDKSIDIIKSIGGSWQQTWQYEKDKKPTIATLLTIQYPYGVLDPEVEMQTTIIVNKNIRTKGVGYFNAFLNTPTSSSPSYSLLAGFLSMNTNLFIDAIYDSKDLVTFELAYEINLPNASGISPGIHYIRDLNGTSHSIGIGLVLLYQTL